MNISVAILTKRSPVQSEREPIETKKSPPLATAFTQQREGVVALNVSIRVDMEELSTMSADRITAFFAGLAQVIAAKSDVETKASGS